MNQAIKNNGVLQYTRAYFLANAAEVVKASDERDVQIVDEQGNIISTISTPRMTDQEWLGFEGEAIEPQAG